MCFVPSSQVVEYRHVVTIDQRLYVLMVSALLLGYVMVRSLKALVPFTTIANFFNLVGLSLVFVNLFQVCAHVT